MSILIFEDSAVPRLNPVTTARPACCVNMGSFSLLELLKQLAEPLTLSVRSYLQNIVQQDNPDISVFGPTHDSTQNPPKLILNSRVIPSAGNLATIRGLLQTANQTDAPKIVWTDDQVAAILNPGWTWEEIRQKTSGGFEQLLLAAHDFSKLECTLSIVSHPHEVIAANMSVIRDNLELRIASEAYSQKQDGVFMAESASIGDYVITDTSDGPIIIDEDASVGPYTLLRGPIYVGPRCRILEHAAIKDEVSLGHTTKIGGEVEAAVVEPFTNKQHHGFLGHSYLGSWINLGAGTCNSDLKNTYGTVNMEYASGKCATGMQFLGCVMGDYSKTAINTGIFTGKVIGVCSMMYGFVTSNVPSYVNYARLFGQMATLPSEVMIATQQRMFSRRKVTQRPSDMQLIHDMYRVTQPERDKFSDEMAF